MRWKWVRWFAIGSFGVLTGWNMLQRRRRLNYPIPESLILEPERELDSDGGFLRILQLQGGYNFRDIGGYATEDGYLVKWGKVYRSGALNGLTDDDLKRLAQLEIKLICDLRSPNEIAKYPDKLPDSAKYHHLPLNTDRTTNTVRRLSTLLLQPQRLSNLMLQTYTEVMLKDNAHLFEEILRRLADPDQLPAVLHCTAGKDRTGVAIMLVLLALGVPETTILTDYTLSNRYYTHFRKYADHSIRRMRWLGIQADDMYPLLIADPLIMQQAINYIRKNYGSVQHYLYQALNLDESIIERLRENLLE